MSFLHRSLSEDKTYEDSLCKVVDCLEEWKNSGNCSPNCLSECPLLCNLVKVSALSPPEVIHHEVNLKRIAIIAATSVISSLFLLTLVILCFNVYRRRRRSVITVSRRWSIEEANEPSPTIIDHPIWHIRTIGLNPTVISSIKACKYSKTGGVVEGTDCSVCLSEFEEEETLRLLPKCRHAFHLSCIDTWLRSHTNCPLCRAPIVVKDDDSEDVEEIRVRVIEEEDGEIDEEVDRDLEEEEEERDEFVSKISTRDHDSLQRVRRSMSLNSLSGVRVSVAGRGKEKMKRSNTGSSIVGRSSFLNRSVSYNCN